VPLRLHNRTSETKANQDKDSELKECRDGLFQRSRDRLKGGLEVAADTRDDRNDRESDPRGDQAIFDGRRSRFILDENYQSPAHFKDLNLYAAPFLTWLPSLLFITG
jgi:hypothetical protein